MVDELVRESAAESFDELVAELPGVWPPDALTAIERLRDRGELSEVSATRLRSRTPRRVTPPAVPWLVPPHPLDADWRFSATTSCSLLDFVVGHGREEPLLLLGTPSLAVAANDERVPAILVDKDPVRLSQLRERLHDVVILERDLSHGQQEPVGVDISMAVADPPWYSDEYRSFIRAASCALAVGGRLIVMVPALGTRPGVASEIASVVRFASTLGLVLARCAVPTARYESPPFEQAALAANELEGLPFEWRSAGILLLDKTCEVDQGARNPPRDAQAGRVEWLEHAPGRSRIRIRTRDSSPREGPILDSLVAGEVLPTVSRRHPMWSQADVWTTGHRAFVSSEPESLFALLEEISEDPAHEDLRTAVGRLRETLASEDRELQMKGWS